MKYLLLLTLILTLLLTSCGSSGSEQKDYFVKVFAVNVDCKFAEEVTSKAAEKFHHAGIPLQTDLHCVTWPKTYELGEKVQALNDLKEAFGTGHFLVPKFGKYFDGVAIGLSSISVGVVGRLKDSAEQMAHELGHVFGASHDFDSCNIMGYRRCEEDAEFNEKAVLEMM